MFLNEQVVVRIPPSCGGQNFGPEVVPAVGVVGEAVLMRRQDFVVDTKLKLMHDGTI